MAAASLFHTLVHMYQRTLHHIPGRLTLTGTTLRTNQCKIYAVLGILHFQLWQQLLTEVLYFTFKHVFTASNIHLVLFFKFLRKWSFILKAIFTNFKPYPRKCITVFACRTSE